MFSPRPPAMPDPYETGRYQGQQNLWNAISNFNLNAIDQITPYGSYHYGLDPTNPYNYEWIGPPGTLDADDDIEALYNLPVSDTYTREMKQNFNKYVRKVPNYRLEQKLSPEMQGLFDKRVENQGLIGGIVTDRLSQYGDKYGAQYDEDGNLIPIAGHDFQGLFDRDSQFHDFASLFDRDAQNNDFSSLFDRDAQNYDHEGFFDLGGQNYDHEGLFDLAGQNYDHEGLFDTSGHDYNFEGLYDATNPYVDQTGVGRALLSRLEPELDRDREQIISNLENRGVTRGSRLWDRAMQEHDRSRQEARATSVIRGAAEDREAVKLAASLRSRGFGEKRADAGLSSTLRQRSNIGRERGAGLASTLRQRSNIGRERGAGLASTLRQRSNIGRERGAGLAAYLQNLGNTGRRADAGLSADLYGRGNQARRADAQLDAVLKDQGLSNDRADRSLDINEIVALLGASRGDSANFLPTYSSPIAGVDVAGIIGQNNQQRLQAWQQQMQSQNQLIGGLLGFGSRVAGAFI